MKILRSFAASYRFWRAMLRWQERGVTPSFEVRRGLCRYIQHRSIASRADVDMVFGPGLVQACVDKAHRRRMALWRLGLRKDQCLSK